MYTRFNTQKPVTGIQLNKQHKLTNGLVGCWLMNEGSGNKVYDLSGYNHTGTFSGDVSWSIAKNGYGIKIGQSEDRITASAKDMGLATGTIEWSCTPSWSSHDDGRSHVFFDTHGGNNTRFTIWKNLSSPGDLNLYQNGAGKGDFAYTFTMGTNYHFALAYPDNKLYINGVLANDFTDGTFGTGADDLYIGDRYTAVDNGSDCTYQWFRIWDHALSATEIQHLYVEPFSMFYQPEIRGFVPAAPSGNAAIMTTNTGFWGPTY